MKEFISLLIIMFVLIIVIPGLLIYSAYMFVHPVETKTITGSYAFTPPENATEINAWIQAQCVSTETCTATDLVIKDIHVDGLIENQFTNLFSTADIMNNVAWSEEYGPVGCNDQLDHCATFLPPQNTFDLHNGNAVITVNSGNYAGLLACNIEKECSHQVSQQEYVAHMHVCHGNDNNTLIKIRFGVDFFTERNGTFINAISSDWYTLGKGDCLVM